MGCFHISVFLDILSTVKFSVFYFGFDISGRNQKPVMVGAVKLWVATLAY